MSVGPMPSRTIAARIRTLIRVAAVWFSTLTVDPALAQWENNGRWKGELIRDGAPLHIEFDHDIILRDRRGFGSQYKHVVWSTDELTDLLGKTDIRCPGGLRVDLDMGAPVETKVRWFATEFRSDSPKFVEIVGDGHSIRCKVIIAASPDTNSGNHVIHVSFPKVVQASRVAGLGDYDAGFDLHVLVWESTIARAKATKLAHQAENRRILASRVRNAASLAFVVLGCVAVALVVKWSRAQIKASGSYRLNFGRSLRLLGTAAPLIFVCLNSVFGGSSILLPGFGDAYLSGIPGFVGIISAAMLMWLACDYIVTGKRMIAPSAEGAIAKDSRRPILYFRSFRDDETRAPWRVRHRCETGRRTTLEQVVCEAFESAGPVVAIGRPGESLPQLGAARMYVPDDRWQTEVRALVSQCQTVILRAGSSGGLQWEFELVATTLNPEQIIIWLGFEFDNEELLVSDLLRVLTRLVVSPPRKPLRDQAYQDFKRNMAHFFPRGLPEHVGNAVFICFDKDWGPRLIVDASRGRTTDGSNPTMASVEKLERELPPKSAWRRLRTMLALILGVVATVLVAAVISLVCFI